MREPETTESSSPARDQLQGPAVPQAYLAWLLIALLALVLLILS